MEKNNYNSLLNIFRYYTQAPGDLKLEIRLTEKEDGEERKQIQKKLEKEYFMGEFVMPGYLNEYQRKAVLDKSSACLVNANVGSGKTTVLTVK